MEEDYGRRQQIVQHTQSSPVPPPLSVVGCLSAHSVANDLRYTNSDKNLLDNNERFNTDRFGSERSNSDRLPSGERYQGVSERYPLGERPQTSISSERLQQKEHCIQDQYQNYVYQRYPERYTPIGSLERYHQIDRYARTTTPTDHRYHQYQNDGFNRGVYKERKERYHRYDQQYERYPTTIPCPERFQNQVQYMEPPSPAPANDRFVPPPPLSPSSENTPSPDCFPNNAFPSPTNTTGGTERFIPPPPLSPSPTETYPSPKKMERRFNDRSYHQDGRFNRYQENGKYVNGFSGGDRFIPPNAHMPVERYVPQPQQEYYYQNYERYPTSKFQNNSDPYMRRDLTYHYRLPLPYTNPNGQYQRMRYISTPNRVKCCQYQDNYAKSSPGSSSSSSSVNSQKDLIHKEIVVPNECQNYCPYQEKGVQCGGGGVGGGTKECIRIKCRHSICTSPSIEYVGASGGRHVCATPPPPIRGVANDGCNENCCTTRRSQNSLTAPVVWRTSPPQQQQQSTSPNDDDLKDVDVRKSPQPSTSSSNKPSPVQRAISLPATTTTSPPPPLLIRPRVNYSQSERKPNRPNLNRSISKKEMIKNYLKKETANFFGVDEENEDEQKLRWLDRRKRMACRTYGPLKDEFNTISRLRQRNAISELPSRLSGQLQAERPDILPSSSSSTTSGMTVGGGDLTDAAAEQDRFTIGVKRKDSVARMTWDGLSYVVNTLTRHQPHQHPTQWSRSFAPETPPLNQSMEDDAFFQKPSQSSLGGTIECDISDQDDTIDRGTGDVTITTLRPGSGGWRRREIPDNVILRGNNRQIQQQQQQENLVGGTRVFSSLLDNVLDNSDRRQYGMGWIGRLFGRSIRHSVTQNINVKQQLDDMEDHRPMFTYWVTTVQILILFISLICYGFGPFGVDLQARSGQVLVTSLSLQQVDYMEPANFWFGPRAGDLIHLGAKFAPCMRVDDKINQQIDKIRGKERETACCIRNDDSGCVQSSQADCSKTISTWKKWNADDSGPGGRISGSVCGLDPKFCDAPASVHPYEWPDDITKWPICRKTNTQFSTQKQRTDRRDKIAEHMVCEVIGHPCCIGIHGQCKITTREYCDFVHGTFHEEASLCSQVSCLNDVCGMLPFYFPETPDQFYRLWTSIFLHAGILQLFVTVLIQYFLMRDLEKLTGSLRIAIIYIGSGVAGNLASAIFVPYRADVGPSGSQFGLLACLIVEVLYAWPMLKHPNQALCKLLTITIVLFLIGLLPWVDNYAHLFGFIFGFLLSYGLLPFISFGKYDRNKKIALIWMCLLLAIFLFLLLVLLFYIIPVYDCKICSYFNCIPFTRDFCSSQNINFKREEPIV